MIQDIEHTKRLYAGLICCRCEAELPAPEQQGERYCPSCDPDGTLKRVVMTFGHRKGWHVSFLAADAHTPLTGYITIGTYSELKAFVRRCNATEAQIADLRQCIRNWGQGSVSLDLMAEQYAKLTR